MVPDPHASQPSSFARDDSHTMPSPPGGLDTAGAGVDTLPGAEPHEAALLETAASLHAVVLAGGIGSRFWPLSSHSRPKPLLALVNERPLIADTLERLRPIVAPGRMFVVTSADIADALHRAVPEVPLANMLVEPHPMGTAAALAWGAQEVARRAGPDAVFCTVHADLAVGLPEEFRRVVRHAAQLAAREDAIIILGARPMRPETGFGYMLPGEPVDGSNGTSENGACRVVRFVEKPDVAEAESLIAQGALWHCGTFVARARVVLSELAELPEIGPGLAALAAGDLPGFAGAVEYVSLDRALFERSEKLVVLPGDFVWDDIGTWASLRRARALDDDGNGAVGPVHFSECSGNLVHSEGAPVVLHGVDSLLVVALGSYIFVTTIERAADLSALRDQLPPEFRPPA